RAAGVNLHALITDPEVDTLDLTDRVTEVDARTITVCRPVGNHVIIFDVGFLVVQGIAPADAVDGVIRIGERKGDAVADIAAVGRNGNTVTGTQEVGLGQVGTKHKTGALLVTHTGADRAGRLLFYRVIHVNLIIFTGYARGFHGNPLEEAQPLQSHLGIFDQLTGCPRTFHLAHFAAQHFIPGFFVAEEIDTTDIHPGARIDIERHVHRVVIIGNRHTIDVGKGITFVTQTLGDQFVGSGDQLTRKRLARLEQDKEAQFFL